MKTPKEWLVTFPVRYAPQGGALYSLKEQDIADIQREALEHALAIVDKYQSSMGTRDGMTVANAIWKEIKELKELSK